MNRHYTTQADEGFERKAGTCGD